LEEVSKRREGGPLSREYILLLLVCKKGKKKRKKNIKGELKERRHTKIKTAPGVRKKT